MNDDINTLMFECDHPQCQDLISMADGHGVYVMEPTQEALEAYKEHGITAPDNLEHVLVKLYETGEAVLHGSCAEELGLE